MKARMILLIAAFAFTLFAGVSLFKTADASIKNAKSAEVEQIWETF